MSLEDELPGNFGGTRKSNKRTTNNKQHEQLSTCFLDETSRSVGVRVPRELREVEGVPRGRGSADTWKVAHQARISEIPPI